MKNELYSRKLRPLNIKLLWFRHPYFPSLFFPVPAQVDWYSNGGDGQNIGQPTSRQARIAQQVLSHCTYSSHSSCL